MGIVPLYFINATIISFSIITIIRQLGERQGHYQLVSFYGKNSLIIVCTNNLVIEICRLIDHKMFCNSLLHMDYIGIFIFFIIITICEYPLLKLFEGKFKRPMTIIKRTWIWAEYPSLQQHITVDTPLARFSNPCSHNPARILNGLSLTTGRQTTRKNSWGVGRSLTMDLISYTANSPTWAFQERWIMESIIQERHGQWCSTLTITYCPKQ